MNEINALVNLPHASASGIYPVVFTHPRLKKIIEVLGPLSFSIPIWKDIHRAVLYAVIGQMLSTKASNSIIQGLLKKIGSPKKVIEWASKNRSRQGALLGVSQRKRKALHSWNEFSKRNPGASRGWSKMPLDEYRGEIRCIWGFGNWAADMIAIFHLGRRDVWPENDTGIKKMSSLVFETENSKLIKSIVRGKETLAALYLWECINRKLIFSFS